MSKPVKIELDPEVEAFVAQVMSYDPGDGYKPTRADVVNAAFRSLIEASKRDHHEHATAIRLRRHMKGAPHV